MSNTREELCTATSSICHRNCSNCVRMEAIGRGLEPDLSTKLSWYILPHTHSFDASRYMILWCPPIQDQALQESCQQLLSIPWGSLTVLWRSNDPAMFDLKLHQWFSPFGFVCIDGKIHSNPFPMYWYVSCLYFYSKPEISIDNSCIINKFVFGPSIQTQYTPIQQVSSQIQT